ncbi:MULTISPECIES: flagellar hook-basal body complex protein FliE [Pontibacillus]|uniref:Flagellar hook-basal body complex protein FliE n=1 Tax=Pontibacillus chungwhensis TaxID=265426 RepID=A0ABY8V3Y5_9BACI|nr:MULTISPECIES: flagellar hook-basal body complex protein FliE [Pontibacillus]MCD5322679.1 flagellar hook-basal body complex protein FliE [Pontibacillus sp. HN14]WIF99957.1 flagellar hook-basal body complex protein FliE [Pontibacillus chungwhensis]
MDPIALQAGQVNLQTSQMQKKISPNEAQSAFATSLKNAIHSVNDAQVQSNLKTEQLAKGEIDNLHDVMITAKKASITLQTAVEVQGKAVDAYKEIMRMQV